MRRAARVQALLGDTDCVRVSRLVGAEPRVERQAVADAVGERLLELAVRFRPCRRRLGEVKRRLGAPFRRRVARPGGDDRDEGEHERLRDRDRTVVVVMLCVLRVLVELLAGFGCREPAFSHAGRSASTRARCPACPGERMPFGSSASLIVSHEAPVGVVVERVLLGGEVHEVEVRAVLAVAVLRRPRARAASQVS